MMDGQRKKIEGGATGTRYEVRGHTITKDSEGFWLIYAPGADSLDDNPAWADRRFYRLRDAEAAICRNT